MPTPHGTMAGIMSVSLPAVEQTGSEENNTMDASNVGGETASNDHDEETTNVVTNAPSPETGVTYKVQILAAHKTVGRTYFKKRHNYAEPFDIEPNDGWIKYTTGSFTQYKDARDDRERINSRYVLPGPFVTAYNEGERITVQEALMITKQQWYQ